MVKLELYRVFREVAEAGNISLAAENLYLSQSAVSQSVKQLEQQLGTRLTDTGKSDADGCEIYTAALYILQQDAPVAVEVHVTTTPERVKQITVDMSALGVEEVMLRPMLTNFFGEGSEKTTEHGSHETIYLDSGAQAVYHVSATTAPETDSAVPARSYTLSISAA